MRLPLLYLRFLHGYCTKQWHDTSKVGHCLPHARDIRLESSKTCTCGACMYMYACVCLYKLISRPGANKSLVPDSCGD
jgi:hypothetical protein